MELMVVMIVIAAIAAMTIPTMSHVRSRAAVRATGALVDALAVAVDAYQTRAWNAYDGGTGELVTYRMWDWDNDAVIDGDPALETPSIVAPGDPHHRLYRSGYRGLFAMAQPSITGKSLNAKQQIVDPWGTPLRIAYAADVYGAGGFGIWSLGRDRSDGPDGSAPAADNITSWKSRE